MACSPSRRDQIADMANSRLDADTAGNLLGHIENCEPCSAEFDLVTDLVSARSELVAQTAPATKRAPKNPVLLMLAAAVFLITPLLIWQPFADKPQTKSHAEFADLTPITAPESMLRGDPGPRGAAFARGMEAYGVGNYTTAWRELSEVCSHRPDDALAHLYLGIALTQTELIAAAIQPLKVAAEHGSGLVVERSLWFLANTYLRTDQPMAAQSTLKQLRDLGGDYAVNAEQLLQRLAGN